MPKEEYLTQEKYDELFAELEFLKHTRRKEIADDLEYAKSLGDLSENYEYQAARELQANIEERIAKLEAIIKYAVIVAMHHSDVVGVGSTATVTRDGDKDSRTYYIVGSEEVDTASGKISNSSPLGQALMGKKKGEQFTFTTPKGTATYTIVDIA
jgi:transcription elongation factor GreA